MWKLIKSNKIKYCVATPANKRKKVKNNIKD